MLRTVYKPDSNVLSVSIPDIYVGSELEILVFPIKEVLVSSAKKNHQGVDTSFGGWADMDKSTEDICSEIRTGRTFRNRELVL